MKREVVVLGATGSIGRSTLEVLKDHKDRLTLKAFTFAKNWQAAGTIVRDFITVETVGIKDTEAAKRFCNSAASITVGQKANLSVIEKYPEALFVNALSGVSGIEASFKVLAQGSCLALANKETLVVAGELYSRLDAKTRKRLFPVDSEHSALLKLLSSYKRSEVKKLMITASGGSLRDVPIDRLATVTPNQVLNHPTWKMGSKITIDSATMVNKAFEVIEAHVLFGFPLENIEVVQHDQSIVHAGLLLADGCYVLESGPNDMRVPISYALNRLARKRVEGVAPLALEETGNLSFKKLDLARYPLFSFILDAYKKGGTSMAVISMADEIAIEAFLDHRISFTDIEKIIKTTYNRIRLAPVDSLEDILYSLRLSEQEAKALVESLLRKESI